MKVGDRVVMIDIFRSGLHGCNGDDEQGHGWYVDEHQIKKIEKDALLSNDSIKELMNKVIDLTEQLELAKKELKDRL